MENAAITDESDPMRPVGRGRVLERVEEEEREEEEVEVDSRRIETNPVGLEDAVDRLEDVVRD